MLGVPPGLNVEIAVIAGCSLRLNGSVLAVFGELLKTLKHLLTHQVALFHPSFGAAGATYAYEATLVFQHLHALAIFHDSNLVVDGGEPIPQIHLRRGDIIDFQDFAAPASASGEKKNKDC